MHLIVAYDAEAERTEIFKKICQIYLVKIQNSVFEGDINEPQLMKLRDLLEKETKSSESVRIWIIPKILRTVEIGRHNPMENGIL